MAFRVLRLIVGLAAVALAIGLAVYGVRDLTDAVRTQGDASRLTEPIVRILVGVAALVLFYLGFIAPSRVHRVLENIFAIPELVTKLGFTAGLLAIYRIGYWIPLPGIRQGEWFRGEAGGPLSDMLETVAMFSGANLDSTLFGLGIMPYITASIIFQLLGTVVPAIERLQREGEAGRRKIQEYTRYATVVLCLVQGVILMTQLRQNVFPQFAGNMGVSLMGILGMTAGTMFLMWLGEQIDEYGIGNGVSLLIMAGIVSRMPGAVKALMDRMTLSFGGGEAGGIGPERIIILVAMFVFVVAGAILITQGQRRIPVQQAKMTRGRRVYGGQRQYLPLRVNHGGVMPIIFASALMMFPVLIFQAIYSRWNNSVTLFLFQEFRNGQFLYVIVEVAMIFFFAYFWTTVQFRPKEMSEQLRDHGSFIPGLRPGRRTAEYLEHVMERITYCGAAFLAVIAVIPTLVARLMNIEYGIAAFLGGTGLLISVSVTLDLVQRIEAQLVMRNYGGFLGEGARIKGAYA